MTNLTFPSSLSLTQLGHHADMHDATEECAPFAQRLETFAGHDFLSCEIGKHHLTTASV
jgi:hypothetical protein